MLLQIAFFGGVANLSFAAALVEGDVVRVMVLFYLLPLWGVLGGAIFLGERLSRLRVLSMFLALGGAFLVLGGFALFQSPPQFIDLVATTAGFCFAMNNLSFRASQELAVPLKVGAMFVGCALAAGVLLSWGAQPFPSELSGSTWSAVVAFGFFVLLITAGTQWGVTHMEAGRSSIIMILELLSAVVSTAVISAHFLTAWETVGATLIVLASLVEARAGPSPDASAPSPG
jgi:drug/metabolite transporter (DMT)-like permease